MDECCCVCAEPLEWVAVGECGHREVCSLCTVRMRFVLKDTRCCFCKQDCPSVFVTRAMNEYTASVGPGGYAGLPNRVAPNGDLHYLPAVEGYFDDVDHYKVVSQITALNCKMCEEDPRPPKFGTLVQLKAHILRNHKLHMCDICLEGRKVFVSEQQCYTRADLERHNTGGSHVDRDSCLGQSGFKGHPQCGFCKKRFYDDGALYTHMQQEHYTCHICQRAEPNKFVYYQDYKKLEEHFRADHYLCDHGECLEKKFIVFQTEQELKRHTAQEHGGQMSKAQRREASTIPVNFSFRSHAEEHSRPGRGMGRGSRNSSASNLVDTGLQQALANSMAPGSGFDGDDGQGRGHGAGSMLRTGSAPNITMRESAQSQDQFQSSPDMFPLPTPAEASGRDGGRLNVQASVGSTRWAATAGAQHSAADFPTLPGSSVGQRGGSAQRQNGGCGPSWAAGSGIGRGRQAAAAALGFGRGSSRGGQPAVASHTGPPGYPDPTQADWGPPLVSSMSSGSAGRGRGTGWQFFAAPLPRSRSGGGSGSTSGTLTAEHMNAEQLREANQALVAKMRELLGGDQSKFDEFRTLSSNFRAGRVEPREYHINVTRLGLVSLVPDLAALCPDAHLRTTLLSVHRAHADNASLTPLDTAVAPSDFGPRDFTTTKDKRAGAGKKKAQAEIVATEQVAAVEAAPTSAAAYTTTGGPSGAPRAPPPGFGKQVEDSSAAGSTDREWTTVAPTSTGGSHGGGAKETKKGKGKAERRTTDGPATIADATSLFAAASLADGQWECGVCTLHNSSRSAMCAACMSPRPPQAREVSLPLGMAEEAGVKGKKGKKGKKGLTLRIGGGETLDFLDSIEARNKGPAWG